MSWRFSFRLPRICLSVPVHTIRELRPIIHRYAGRVDLIEVRLDWLQNWTVEDLEFLRGVPVLWTFRPTRQGGRFTGSDRERVEVLQRLGQRGLGTWVDLEYDVWAPYIESLRPYFKVLLSFHRFDGTLPPWPSLLELFRTKPCDAIKIAVHLTTWRDIVRYLDMVEACQTAGLEGVWVIMGERGTWFRILAPWFGSLWTYAAPYGVEVTTGAGQVSVEELIQVYRFPEMAPDHPLYALLGDPVGHSLSPYIHNFILRRLGLPGHYVPIAVDDLTAMWSLLDFLPLRGMSVTIPHKMHVMAFLDRLDAAARHIGAVNTVIRQDTGWVGTNTDWIGFWRPLVQVVQPRLRGALIVGAGGAAHAVAYALTRANIPFGVVNRTHSKAVELAERLGGQAVAWHDVDPNTFDLLVHTTPVGMVPDENAMPPIPETWMRGKIVYDLVYNPPETRLLRRAREVGARRTIPGLPMLAEQAAEQIRLWTGQRVAGDECLVVAQACLERLREPGGLFTSM